ncbi:hypothetical protein [Hoylesella nanceiensis]|uniref:hypothetical protein n=1 Tax=Hoylesella nanceiensis TaxID=425941 RepID=UPI001CAD5F2E|nr:hypothetical protein [Hoylesella nanceiensis]MBF1428921.1 hypothetical protein [Hoylesella nanceiensis]
MLKEKRLIFDTSLYILKELSFKFFKERLSLKREMGKWYKKKGRQHQIRVIFLSLKYLIRYIIQNDVL